MPKNNVKKKDVGKGQRGDGFRSLAIAGSSIVILLGILWSLCLRARKDPTVELGSTGGDADRVTSTVPIWASASLLDEPVIAESSCSPSPDAPVVPGGCQAPRREGRCSRFVADRAVADTDVREIRGMLEWLIEEAWGAGSGPPSVVDLHQGSISYKDKFVELEALMNFKYLEFTRAQVDAYVNARTSMRSLVSRHYGVPEESLLWDLSFFSHINASKTVETLHDEYWHTHVDTAQYGTFEYTVMLYLNTKHSDFEGGSFVFEGAGADRTDLGVEPRAGRVVAFTSDSEHPHRVEHVTKGIRMALTTSFTCVAEKANSIEPWPREGRGGAHGGGQALDDARGRRDEEVAAIEAKEAAEKAAAADSPEAAED